MVQFPCQCFRRIEEGEPYLFLRYIRHAPAMKHVIGSAALLPVRRGDGTVTGTIGGHSDGLLLQRCLQPNFPGLPGLQIIRQRDVEGAGREKNSLARILRKSWRRRHRAGERLKECVRNHDRVIRRFPLKIQQHTAAAKPRRCFCQFLRDPLRVMVPTGNPVVENQHSPRGQGVGEIAQP